MDQTGHPYSLKKVGDRVEIVEETHSVRLSVEDLRAAIETTKATRFLYGSAENYQTTLRLYEAALRLLEEEA